MNAYWGHQRQRQGRPPGMPPGVPGYGTPTGYGPPEPPHRDRGNRLMLVMTLVGTVATVVSVLLAMGVGPFDLTEDKSGTPAPASIAAAADADAAGQTLKGYVTQVNKVCSDRQAELTQKVDELDQAAVDFQQLPSQESLVGLQRALRSASLSLSSLITQINAVPKVEKPAGDARDAEDWRAGYEQTAVYLQQASSRLDENDFDGFDAAFTLATDSPESDAVAAAAAKIGIVCN
ncbi:hypothetical protein LO772_09620 [Yinghuangia sp. ASG 101]|uniref:hypothetical protein n=1 Tax=Yinghuangia sp. ASG 101 TaxID=2896848 RepID=UPI001E482DA9|nr:hypothetical protein [Yinghuangia sp. ASG 101]UGQ13822.1 hypothetical protein LO772_09620 [Yinghuangia sp. ASG 101]